MSADTMSDHLAVANAYAGTQNYNNLLYKTNQ